MRAPSRAGRTAAGTRASPIFPRSWGSATGIRPPEFDAIAEDGRAFAGAPEGAAEYVQKQLAATGANYFVGQFAFGNLTQEETLHSIGLFANEVMTMLRRAPARAASA